LRPKQVIYWPNFIIRRRRSALDKILLFLSANIYASMKTPYHVKIFQFCVLVNVYVKFFYVVCFVPGLVMKELTMNMLNLAKRKREVTSIDSQHFLTRKLGQV